MISQKGIASVFIIGIIIAALAVSAGGFVLLKNSSNQRQQNNFNPGSVPASETGTSEKETGTPIGASVGDQAKTEDSSWQKPAAKKTSLDPKLLIGLWKLDKVLGFDSQENVWKESQGATAVEYQEFASKALCLFYTIMPGQEPEATRFKCQAVSPYAVEADRISFEAFALSGAKETAYYRWDIVDGKLELGTGPSDTPFLKYVYTKTPVSWPAGSISLSLKDSVPPEQGKPFKIEGVKKTTETINVWLTDKAGNILSAQIESFWCSSLGLEKDICMTEPSSRMSFDSKPDNLQCPFSEIPWGSHPEIGQAVCFVPQAAGSFEIEFLIKKPGAYTLRTKAVQSGVEAKLPITIP